MSQNFLCTFNPFNMRMGSNGVAQSEIQETIYYSESKFWQALLLISKANADNQKWMQQVLQLDLLSGKFVLNFEYLLRFHPQHVQFHFYFFILQISLEQHAMNACSFIFTFFHA